MKRTTKIINYSGFYTNNLGSKVALIAILMVLSASDLYSQSVAGSTWDAAGSTAGSGYTNHGSGVITLTDTLTGSGVCQGAAVHETTNLYNPTLGAPFNQCYRVFFGCPTNDQIGNNTTPYTDFNGDGLAFTFWKSTATYNFNGTTCGGGLGYDNAVSDLKAVTIEFDTYSSYGGDNVDPNYGGGTSGINDEIAIHINAETRDEGRLTAVNAGNLEDGYPHDICITYTPATDIMLVTVDGVTRMNYNMGGNRMEDYFGNIGLRQTWSAGKYGANNYQTIAPIGTSIIGVIGRPLCPGSLPVELLNFNGKKVQENVVLNWTTASEKSNEKFILERSSNHTDWEVIGEVDGAGNSNSINEYQFTDYATLSNLSYYRIRQVDFDGTYSFSKVISVKSDSHEIIIAPNPFDNQFTISCNQFSEGEVDIKIQDVLGRVLYQVNRKVEGNSMTIQPELPTGAYLITLQSDNFIEQRKLIKK